MGISGWKRRRIQEVMPQIPHGNREEKAYRRRDALGHPQDY